MIKVTINRSEWHRGNGENSPSALVMRAGPNAGKMCCLGFAGIACGVPRQDMIGVCTPSGLPLMYDEMMPKGSYTEVMLVNDSALGENDVSSEADREVKITALFAMLGMEPEFVDEEP